MVEKKLGISSEVKIEIGEIQLGAFLHVPPEAHGIVLFAHGSGSGRHSPRNQYVAKALQDENIGTLLLDLLTEEEEVEDMKTRELRFNIPFLAKRLMDATEWVGRQPELHHLTYGYFGASTGAAAALIAASELGDKIKAVVSRGGRTDLAGSSLSHVKSATLFIVGGNDHGVIELNHMAFDLLTCKKKLEIIAGATHLFEEPGALEQVSRMAARWFESYL
jgi:putative phosphoribosyl transferase